MRSSDFLVSVTALLVAGCVGKTLDVGTDAGLGSDAEAPVGSNADAGLGPSADAGVGPGEAGEPPGTDSGGGDACQATCSTPAGTVEATTTLDQAYAQVEGRWLFCSVPGFRGAGAPADAIGVEFGPGTPSDAGCGLVGSSGCGGGSFYYLVNGPSGPQRGQGFAYQLTYDISPEGGESFQLNVHPAPNSGFGGSFRYSPCPTELEIESTDVLVALSPGDTGNYPTLDGGSPGNDGGGTVLGDGGGADTCPAASSPQAVSSPSAGATVFPGRWQVCSGEANVLAFTQTSDVVGMEFGPATSGGGYCGTETDCLGGPLYYLVQGDAGALVRGQGFAYQAAYELSGEGNEFFLDLSPQPNGGWTTSVLYSSTPQEIDITSLGYNTGAVLVALP